MASPSPFPPSRSSAVSLATLPTSVRVHSRKSSLDEGFNNPSSSTQQQQQSGGDLLTRWGSRDSLERTRDFYGVSSSSSSPSIHQNRARSSSLTRPTSPPQGRPSSSTTMMHTTAPQHHPLLPTATTSQQFTSGILPSRSFFSPQVRRPTPTVPPSSVLAQEEEALGAVASRTTMTRRPSEDRQQQSPFDEGPNRGGGLGADDAAEQERQDRFQIIGKNATSSREPLIAGGLVNSSTLPRPSSEQQQQQRSSGRNSPQSRHHPSSSRPGTAGSRPGTAGEGESSTPLQQAHFQHQQSFSPPSARLASTSLPPPSSSSASQQPPIPFSPGPFASTLEHYPPTSPNQQDVSLSADPLRPAKRTTTPYYKIHPSDNKFLLGGRIVLGGDSSSIPFLISILLQLGLGGLWLGTTGVWIWHDGIGGSGGSGGIAVVIILCYIWLVAVGAMFGTALRDPGILPRGLDPEPRMVGTTSSESLVPAPRELRVRAGKVTVKYCETCEIYRPPRSSHCRVCNNCVDGIDHHCTYLRTCVGRRTYTSFISFLIFTFLSLIYTIVWSAIHLYLLTRRQEQHLSFGEALGKNVGSAVSFVLGCLIVLPLGTLMLYHVRLMLNAMTTIEDIRRSAARRLARPSATTSGPISFLLFWRRSHRSQTDAEKASAAASASAGATNPFGFGKWTTNFARMLCRPVVPSWMGFRDEVAWEGDAVEGEERDGGGGGKRRVGGEAV